MRAAKTEFEQFGTLAMTRVIVKNRTAAKRPQSRVVSAAMRPTPAATMPQPRASSTAAQPAAVMPTPVLNAPMVKSKHRLNEGDQPRAAAAMPYTSKQTLDVRPSLMNLDDIPTPFASDVLSAGSPVGR